MLMLELVARLGGVSEAISRSGARMMVGGPGEHGAGRWKGAETRGRVLGIAVKTAPPKRVSEQDPAPARHIEEQPSSDPQVPLAGMKATGRGAEAHKPGFTGISVSSSSAS